ncbi:deaminase domain-containing protein [Streptomyces sp. DSM 41886]|uniref:Deaminase domain-containing protein n=2 Tax=Streptomyces johnsoniae TaxID=3075532 RepID=A0ABU2SC86_9ACTN|nr:deaminase domain-containing protein [Streptomyces sp. DSM 41886]
MPRALPNQNPNNSRYFDTEFKLLNYIANQLGLPSSTHTGRMDLHSKLEVCGSRSSVIDQFRSDFPNIEINVSWG